MVDEEKLIQAISQAIPVALHCRYIYLCEKNSNETITPKEHKELIKLIDKVEIKNVERIKKLIELAKIRNVSLDTVMRQLDIHPMQEFEE